MSTSYRPHLLSVLAFLFAHTFIVEVTAHDHGDSNPLGPMTDDMPMTLMEGNMIPYLHFTPLGDNLWFQGWVPIDAKGMAGACFGLFLLAVAERWLAGFRGIIEGFWKERANRAYVNSLNAESKPLVGQPSVTKVITMRSIPPFIPMYDIPRGLLYGFQSAIGFLLMLAVMMFQGGFIIAIVLGLGVGEMLFGRYSTRAHLH